MFVLKSGETSTFGDNIDLIDEMIICGIAGGHYAEAELSELELKFLQRASRRTMIFFL